MPPQSAISDSFAVLAPEAVLSKNFLFIIGAPRSGTSWLQAMLGAHPQVCTTVELTLFDCYIGPWMARWNEESAAARAGKWHQGLPSVWSEDEFCAFITELIGRVYQRVTHLKPEATHVLDKQPLYAHHTELIKRFIPHSRFIHIVRDGRDVAASMVAAQRSMGFGADNISAAAAEWKQTVQAARRAAQWPDDYHEIRYEDLLANPVDQFTGVLEFTGLTVDPSLVEFIVAEHSFEKMKNARKSPLASVLTPRAHFRRGSAGGWRNDLGLLDRFRFESIAGDLLRELKYADGPWCAPRGKDRAALALLLPMVYLNDLRRRIFQALAR